MVEGGRPTGLLGLTGGWDCEDASSFDATTDGTLEIEGTDEQSQRITNWAENASAGGVPSGDDPWVVLLSSGGRNGRLSPLLGADISGRPWLPRDGRILQWALHRRSSICPWDTGSSDGMAAGPPPRILEKALRAVATVFAQSTRTVDWEAL